MIKIEDKSSCSGCSACYSICPKDAISMKEDTLGFKYPDVNLEKCIDCDLCVRVCAFNDSYQTPNNFDAPKLFAARQTDISEVEKSRSGGIFAALSDIILDNGGVIYGAGYDSSFRVIHKRADSKVKRDEFRGSKYVQSDMGDIFRQVEKDLKSGLQVLFSGTPCQTAGLASYLRLHKIDMTNIFICDIVCHGVPAPAIWKDYIAFIEKKEKKKVIAVNFRDKQRFGWSAHKESFRLDDTYTYTYTYTFYKHIMFRHSCGVCHYTNFRRTGDITLADFWGWQNTDSEINADDKGVSLIFVNTPKGEKLFSDISDRIRKTPTVIEKCLQPNLQHPSKIHPKRMQFEADYPKLGFEKLMCKYALMGWRFNLNNFILKIQHLITRNRIAKRVIARIVNR